MALSVVLMLTLCAVAWKNRRNVHYQLQQQSKKSMRNMQNRIMKNQSMLANNDANAKKTQDRFDL